MFATGIENSYPTINHGKTRVDEMEVCGHYERWREDFDCVQEIGNNYLRYGPPIHRTWLAPINEMFICAVFSAKYGWWNEQKKDDRSFITCLKHIVKANVLAMIEILKRRHDAIFIQSESSEYYHADSPAAIGRAEVLNQVRFLSLDLNYGRRVDSGMYQYLLDNGMLREEYEWFLEHQLKQHCILGNDYYQLNEHRVFAGGHTVAAGETFGYAEITRQYYNRYRLPVMHTETNLWEGPHGDEAV